MILATVSKPVLLSAVAGDGRTDLFSQVKILNSSGTLVTTISLPHQSLGVYAANWTPTTEGYYSAVYGFYFDAGFTISAGYETVAEAVDVNSFKTDIKRLLGLAHENAVVDQEVYDSDDNLTSARIRCYDTAVNAAAAYAASPGAYTTGQQFEYAVAAAYNAGRLSKYTITTVSGN